MDSQSIKQDIYQAIDEFNSLDPTADDETITSLFATIRVFTDELPVYPNPQTQAQIDASNLAHSESEADLMYFTPSEDGIPSSTSGREEPLVRLQARAKQIGHLLRADS